MSSNCVLLRKTCLPVVPPRLILEDSCILVPRVVLLSGVAFALAGGHHGYLVGPGGAILTLQPYALGPGPVDDATPLHCVPSAPVAAHVTTPANPVGEEVGRQALPGAHQLFNGVHAGALAVGDVLGGPQLSAAHLTLVWTWNIKTQLEMVSDIHRSLYILC